MVLQFYNVIGTEKGKQIFFAASNSDQNTVLSRKFYRKLPKNY